MIKRIMSLLILACLIGLPACQAGLDTYGDLNCSGDAQFDGDVTIDNELWINGYLQEPLETLDTVVSRNEATDNDIQVGGLTIQRDAAIGDPSLTFNNLTESRYLFMDIDGFMQSNATWNVLSLLLNEGDGVPHIDFSDSSGWGQIAFGDDRFAIVGDIQIESGGSYRLSGGGEQWEALNNQGAFITYLHAPDEVRIGTDTTPSAISVINDAILINGEYTFPVADGAAYQIIETDGVGNLGWTDPPVTATPDLGQVTAVGALTDEAIEVGKLSVKPRFDAYPSLDATSSIVLYHASGTIYLEGIDDGLTIRNDGGELLRIANAGVMTIADTWELPTDTGADDQVLTSDGTGGTAWEDNSTPTLDNVVEAGDTTGRAVTVGDLYIGDDLSLLGNAYVVGNTELGGTLKNTDSEILAFGDKTIDFTISKPLSLSEASNLPVWTNNMVSTNFIIDRIIAMSDTNNVDFTLKRMTSISNFGSPVTIHAVTINNAGIGVYSVNVSSPTQDTIPYGYVMVFDNDATDDPDYVAVTITGHYVTAAS